MSTQSLGGAGQAELPGVNALPRCCPLPPLSSAATGSLEKSLQNIKIFVSAPFGAAVLCVAEHGVTCGRVGGLGWVGLSPRSLVYFPSKKVLWCWPSWSSASPSGVDVGLHEKHIILPQPALATLQCLFWDSETAAQRLRGVFSLFQASVSVFMSRVFLLKNTAQHRTSCKVWGLEQSFQPVPLFAGEQRGEVVQSCH